MQENNLQDFDSFDEIDLTHLFTLLRRNFWLLLLGLLLAGGAAFLFSRYQTPIYEAKTQVMVVRSASSSPVSDVTQALNVTQLSQTYVELLSQDWLRELVVAQIGGELEEDAVKISAATNTQIIKIRVEDPQPARAIAVADALVKVLLEQNAAIQANRNLDAEQSLNVQIAEAEQQILDIQATLEAAKEKKVSDEVATAQEGIASTQAEITAIEGEIKDLEALWTDGRARIQLYTEEGRLRSYQANLAVLLKRYSAMEAQLPPAEATPPPEGEDEATIALREDMAALGIQINETNDQIAKVQEKIAWLTPLTEEDGVDIALTEKENELAVQQALLASYQAIVTELLSTGESKKADENIATIEDNLDLHKQIYLNLLDSRETLRREREQNMTNLIQLTPAAASNAGEPVRPRILLNTALGAIAGLILAVALVLLSDFLDSTLKTREDIENTLKIPVMGRLLTLEESETQKDGPYVVHVPRSPAAEAFRSLRTNLEYLGIDEPLKSILVSSPGAAEGKTTVAANLAAVIAQSGKRVVILDADLRRPRMHREMGLVNRVGLSDIIRDKIALEDAIQPWGDDLNLSVITSGGIPPNPAEMLGSEKMTTILAQLEARFDTVIIDSTPTLVTDSQLIAARAGGVLLVLWPGRTQAEAARATVEQYRRVGARILGAVLNNQSGNGYGYDGYSAYQYYQYDQGSQKGGFQLPWRRKAKKR